MHAVKKRIILQELADYFGVSRPTIHAWLKKYNRAYKEKYDPTNINSVFDFFTYLQKR